MTDHFSLAQKYTPGGVHSPVRACAAVGMSPTFWQSAMGAYLVDVSGRSYIDYISGFGPNILGHGHPALIEALQSQLNRGLIYGGCAEQAPQLAELICTTMPAIEQVRFMNSGTEGCMTAVRIARAATGRDQIIKCRGAYHGHADMFLVQAGSGALTLGQPSSPGVPHSAVKDTFLVPFNDIAAVEACLSIHGKNIAAIMVEPICGNMGMILPEDGYLEALRKLSDRYDVCLIFDEVMTGFRVALGGAQGHYQVKPDLTVLGKVIGGGLPIGAVGGKIDLMQQLSPLGPVYQAGTFSANPMTMTAGITALQHLMKPGVFDQLHQHTRALTTALHQLAQQYHIPLQVSALGGMFGTAFSALPVTDLLTALQINTEQFKQFYQQMHQGGVLWPPSAFEALFITLAHDDQTLSDTLNIAEATFKAIAIQQEQAD